MNFSKTTVKRISLYTIVQMLTLQFINSSCYCLPGSHSHRISRVSSASGDVIWTRALGGRIESSACYCERSALVVVGCYDHSVYVLAYGDGSVSVLNRACKRVRSRVEKVKMLSKRGSCTSDLCQPEQGNPRDFLPIAFQATAFDTKAY